MSLADEVRGGRILDVGVGAGRTTWLLRLLSDRYVAIDYTPEMVDLARQNHPDVDIRLGDARLLGDFTDRWFDLVVFSCNGIDAVSHVDRALVLNELARVLRPGGLLILSTMNKDGNAYGEVPWRVGTATDPSRGSLFRALKVMTVLPRTLPGLPQSLLNWRHDRQRSEDHGDWGIAPLAAHHFGLLIHYCTVAYQVQELAVAGLEVRSIWSNEGRRVEPGEASAALFHNFVATKTAAGH